MGLGIGINTGLARVGNTGSRRKFKYGPLGDTVNVASRVQGASKYFKSSLLITRATRDRLGPGFQSRRLGTARSRQYRRPDRTIRALSFRSTQRLRNLLGL